MLDCGSLQGWAGAADRDTSEEGSVQSVLRGGCGEDLRPPLLELVFGKNVGGAPRSDAGKPDLGKRDLCEPQLREPAPWCSGIQRGSMWPIEPKIDS